MPHISIVLPTYNRAHLLKRSLASVLEQSYRDLELLVVDDGSHDDTEHVVSNIGDPRINYLRHSTNKGASAARNTGIEAARGLYVGFQDSDDVWLPSKLSDQLACLEQDGSLDVVFTSFVKRHPAHEFVLPPKSVAASEVATQLTFGNFIGTPTVVARRSALLAGGAFDTRLRNHEDWDLWLTLASRGARFHHLAKVLLISPHSPGGVSDAQAAELAEAFEQIYLKHHGLFEKTRADAHMNYLIGKLYSSGHPSMQPRGQAFLRRAATREPLNPKYALSFLLSSLNPSWPQQLSRLKGKR